MWSKLLVLTLALLVQHLDATCDVCQVGNVACHSQNTYSICINDVPTNDTITCPTGYICTGDKYICYPETDYEPICTPVVDPQAFCTDLDQAGSYTNTADPTCKTFIFCSLTGTMKGYVYSCATKTPYFNGTGCQAEKPDGCT